MDVYNAITNMLLLVPSYGAISNIPKTGTGLPHTLESLAHIDLCVDAVTTVLQIGPKWQRQVFDGTIQALKWLLFSLPDYTKDLVSVKNLLTGEGNWTCANKVMGCMVDTDTGTVALPDQNPQ